MLGVNQLDFLNYTTAFKGNYRKGPHKLRAILSTPTQANEFCSNLGGVSVIFGVPLDHPDKNSEELLEILQGSPYNDLAVETWLHSFYEFETLDDLLNDAVTCKALANNALMFRAVGMGKVTVGKLICGLAGLDPASYEDIGTVVASDLAMAAVAGSQPAMAAAVKSPVAMTAMAGSAIAMAAVAKSQIAMTAVAASQTAMAAVAGNTNAMKAVASSAVALNAICKNATARAAFIGSAYRDTYYSQILSSLGNTTYFTAKTTSLNSGEVKAWDTDYYINGSSFAVNTTTAKTADSSFCYIETAYAESSSHNAKITTLQGSVSLLSTTSTSKTARHWCIPGGFKYNNANFTGCRVYLAK